MIVCALYAIILCSLYRQCGIITCTQLLSIKLFMLVFRSSLATSFSLSLVSAVD